VLDTQCGATMKLFFIIITMTVYSTSAMTQAFLLNNSGISHIQIGKPFIESHFVAHKDHPFKKKYLVNDGYTYFFCTDSALIGEQSNYQEVIAATDSSQKVAGIFITVRSSVNFGIKDLREIFGFEQLRSELGFGEIVDHNTSYWKTSTGTVIFFVEYVQNEKLNEIEMFSPERFEDRPSVLKLGQE
jgi:hypothetical protein